MTDVVEVRFKLSRAVYDEWKAEARRRDLPLRSLIAHAMRSELRGVATEPDPVTEVHFGVPATVYGMWVDAADMQGVDMYSWMREALNRGAARTFEEVAQ